MNQKERWIMEPGDLVTFLPADLDRSELVDVTRIGDRFRRFIDTRTGRTHDCAEYWDWFQREGEAP